MRSVIEKRQIDLKKGKEIMARLNEIPDPIVTARQFIVMNFDELQQSGKALRALHQFLLNNGLDVGSYEYFQAVYNSVKRSRKANPSGSGSSSSVAILEKGEPEKPTKPERTAPELSMIEKTKDGNDVKKRPRGVGLRPLCLADGTEIEIDPNTGARIFQIRSNQNKEVQA
jgi:hypothetical protein